MRYVKNEQFVSLGGVIEISDDADGPKHQATVGEVLRLVMNNFQPIHDLQLVPAQIRLFNRCLEILEEAPQHDDYYGFEDADFDVLKRVVVGFSPYLSMNRVQFWRNAPALEDLLTAAPKSLPDQGTEQ